MCFAIFCRRYSFALEAGILRHRAAHPVAMLPTRCTALTILVSLSSLAWRIPRMWLLSILAIKPAMHP